MSVLTRRSVICGSAASAATLALGRPALAALNKYTETGTPSQAGRVSGTVFYRGTGVETPVFPVIKDHDICGHEDRSPKSLRVKDTGELGDVVVEIKGMSEGKSWDNVFNNGKIYQIDCSFQPYVQIIRSNAYVDVHNFDSIMHNIHAYEVFKSTRRSMFNFAQPRKGQVDRIELSFRRGNVLMIDCNAHNWMAAYVYTSSSPYLSVTSLDGRFDIPDVPPGTYSLSVWHPVLGERTAQLNVAPNAALNFDLNLD
jgi:hypothetical protein